MAVSRASDAAAIDERSQSCYLVCPWNFHTCIFICPTKIGASHSTVATNIWARLFRRAVNIAAARPRRHFGSQKKRFRKDVKGFENSYLSNQKLHLLFFLMFMHKLVQEEKLWS